MEHHLVSGLREASQLAPSSTGGSSAILDGIRQERQDMAVHPGGLGMMRVLRVLRVVSELNSYKHTHAFWGNKF